MLSANHKKRFRDVTTQGLPAVLFLADGVVDVTAHAEHMYDVPPSTYVDQLRSSCSMLFVEDAAISNANLSVSATL